MPPPPSPRPRKSRPRAPRSNWPGKRPLDLLRAAVAKDVGDRQARFDLATALHAAGDVDGAVDTLLDLFKLDREWNNGAAKTQLFTLFEALGPQDPIGIKGRRRLSSMIFV